ncbi:hypothetical protein BDN70DRAFT_956996 [Pholiota conissans]|uniref:Uncharacterized protein n=1 Tax=Pholiota conissans TaxID=109636 RepID=A0A9P6CX68_9AGAR|nr:hypothetical protein BDN70DRAFT_956996 [Pholiota conissans]
MVVYTTYNPLYCILFNQSDFASMQSILESECQKQIQNRLERNIIVALESVPLESMQRFANRYHQFMDTYSHGLNGKQAAWESRKYWGHRVLPES